MITYDTELDHIDWDQLIDLYGAVGLVAGNGKERQGDKIRLAFECSYQVVTAWDGGMLIGAARMLSDGVCYGTIHDVGVLPGYRKMGVGRGLVEHLEKEHHHLHLYLTATFGKEEFYRKLGYKRHKTAFAKYPMESDYLMD